MVGGFPAPRSPVPPSPTHPPSLPYSKGRGTGEKLTSDKKTDINRFFIFYELVPVVAISSSWQLPPLHPILCRLYIVSWQILMKLPW